MKNSTILTNKKRGETMGQLVERVRRELDLANEEKIAFTGRLDPLAEGLVIFVTGNQLSEREGYLALDKTYTFDVIFGVKTDTGDVLGKLIDTGATLPEEKSIKRRLEDLTGLQNQPFPAYSSRVVRGKPLFQHARDETLAGISIPAKQVNIHNLELTSCKEMTSATLREETLSSIDRVHGDFRQKEIVAIWESFFSSFAQPLHTCSFEARVSSGTYIRVLAEQIAKTAGTMGVAHNIRRTQVGAYRVSDAHI